MGYILYCMYIRYRNRVKLFSIIIDKLSSVGNIIIMYYTEAYNHTIVVVGGNILQITILYT